jgi:hypothetical protein
MSLVPPSLVRASLVRDCCAAAHTPKSLLRFKTKVKQDDLNPEWNETFTFKLEKSLSANSPPVNVRASHTCLRSLAPLQSR